MAENRSGAAVLGPCQACGESKVLTTCHGCDGAFCERCLSLEIQGSGCGSVWATYYCERCIGEEKINQFAALRSDTATAVKEADAILKG